MSYPHRIAAGGIIFKGDFILLVGYHEEKDGKVYLVGPGGALLDNENIIQAIIRETKEETGIIVKPKRVIIIEDLISSNYKELNICKMIKLWMICDYIDGEVQKTKDAEIEGIIEVGWYTRRQLANRKVFPSILLQHEWDEIKKESWQMEILSSRII